MRKKKANKKKMNKEEIITVILMVINFFLLVFSVMVLTVNFNIGIILTLMPLSIGTLTLAVLKKRRRYKLTKALKYANISFMATFVILIMGFLLIIQTATEQTLRINPVIEACITRCQEASEEIRECIENCLK